MLKINHQNIIYWAN